MRLNQYIASSGYCSRRGADELINNGFVTVNGKPATQGMQVAENDKVVVRGKRVQPLKTEKKIYLAYNKPKDVITTTDRRSYNNIIDAINFPERIFPIGRLDCASEGLILLTNDGTIVNPLLRQEFHHVKEYEVTVNRKITPEFLHEMSLGVPILDTVTKPCKLHRVDAYKFRIELTQGLNRQIRRMCEYFNYEVVNLRRIRILHITLGNLKPGTYRYLTPKELAELKRLLHL